MGIFTKSVSLIFSPLTKAFKKFKKYWKKRNKFWKVILAIILGTAIIAWFITVVSILGTILVLNLGIIWVQGVWNLATSIVNTGSSKISGKKKRGKSKTSPPRKKPRGGRKNKRKKTSRS